MEEKIKQWADIRYSHFFKQTIKEWMAYCMREKESLQRKFLQEVDSFFQHLVALQADFGEIPLATIREVTFSFLLTSWTFGEPVFQLDAYGEGGRAVCPGLAAREIAAPWFTSFLQPMEEAFLQQIRKEGLARFVRPVQVSLYSLRALRTFVFFLGSTMKYGDFAVEKLPSYQALKKENSFTLSFGEYYDWQRPLYATFPAIELEKIKGKEPSYFRVFQNQRYDTSFEGLFLMQSRFESCVFTDLSLSQCRFLDCHFVSCQFLSVQVEESQFYGTHFEQSQFQDLTFTQTQFAATLEKERTESYRNVFFVQCQFESVHFASCVCDAVRLFACKGERVTQKGSQWSGSDLFVWLEKEEESDGLFGTDPR